MTDNWTGAKTLFDHLSEHRGLQQLPEVPGAKGTLRRLRDALTGEPGGWRDLASLTRQILLEAQARENTSGFTIPLLPWLPTREQWEEMRCQTAIRDGGTNVWVSALPWHPPVPDAVSRQAAQEDLRQIYLGEDSPHRRKLDSYPADPFSPPPSVTTTATMSRPANGRPLGLSRSPSREAPRSSASPQGTERPQ